MSFNYSPKVVNDSSLVMYLDAANTKSLADVPSQNLVTWSEDFTNGTWGKSNLTVSGDTTTSPIGTSTADSLIENSGVVTQHAIIKTVTVTSGNTFTYSIYLKPNSRFSSAVWVFDSSYTNGFGGNFNLTASTVTNLSQGTGVSSGVNQIINVGNGWYRCKITGTIPTVTSFNVVVYLLNDSGISNYSGDGISNLFLWGAQLELGSVATTYIPTTTVAVSRIPTWVDLSRGGNNGTLTSGLTYNYSNGGGLVFDGVSNYVSLTSNPSLTNQITIDVWVKLQSTTPFGTGWIVGRESSYRIIYTNSLFYWVCATVNNAWYSTGTVISASSNPTSGIYNVVGTYDGSNLRIYINGVLITTGSSISGNILNNGTYYLFNSVAGSVDNGKGTIYSTKLYNRALSAAEVLQNYNTTKSRFGL